MMNQDWIDRIEKLERNEARLERENRRMRAVLSVCLVVAACGIFVAAADEESASDKTTDQASGARSASVSGGEGAEHIRARSITIVDAQGRERIRLESLDTEPGLFLTDEEWKNLSDMQQASGLTGIAVADSDGARRAAMWTYDKASADLLLNGQENSASVLIRGATGGGSLLRMNEAGGKHQIVMAASEQLAQLGVVGGHEERGVSLASSAEVAEMRVSGGKASPTSLLYSTQAGGGHSQMIFQHRPADSPLTPSLAVGVAPNARPAINLYDRDGKRRAAAELSAEGEPSIETIAPTGNVVWSASTAPAPAPAAPAASAPAAGDDSGPVSSSGGFSMKPGRIIPNPPPAGAAPPAPKAPAAPEAPPAPPQPPAE